VRALAESTSLHQLSRLDLAHNPIRDEGAVLLAEWRRNVLLDELKLHFCSIGDTGALALAVACEERRIERLTLAAHTLSPDVIRELRERLGQRVSIF